MSSLQNDIIFRDRLTGLYNRAYLDSLKDERIKRKQIYITGIMLDLNDFKSINDRFGHAAGDEALIFTSDIIREAVKDLGNIIRYAGDEFVILINTHEDIVTLECMNRINAGFTKFNKSGRRPYKLSASMGYSVLDIQNQTMNDFLNTIDKKMYEAKAEFYNKVGNNRRHSGENA